MIPYDFFLFRFQSHQVDNQSSGDGGGEYQLNNLTQAA
jgi:hypothetical protein